MLSENQNFAAAACCGSGIRESAKRQHKVRSTVGGSRKQSVDQITKEDSRFSLQLRVGALRFLQSSDGVDLVAGNASGSRKICANYPGMYCRGERSTQMVQVTPLKRSLA